MVPDYVLLPPETNSARIYLGPRSGSMWAAAAAWDVLASELSSAAGSFQSAVLVLGGSWQGPSAVAMAAAAVPYVLWLSSASAQAEQAALEARLSAGAFDAAFIATVPPPAIAVNRAQLMMLIATNILGQNTAAIAATETEYAEMWAQDVTAMTGYDASTAAVEAQWTSFSAPPPDLPGSGTPAPSALDLAQLLSQGTQSSLFSQLSTTMSRLQMLSTPAELAMEPMNMVMGQMMTGANPLLGGATGSLPATSPALMPAATPALSIPSAAPSAMPLAGAALTTGLGRAGSVGALSVPSTWPASPPAVAAPAAPAIAAPAAATGTVAASAPGMPSLPSLGTPARALGAVTPAVTASRIRAVTRTAPD
jgi:PPE-repeat protein